MPLPLVPLILGAAAVAAAVKLTKKSETPEKGPGKSGQPKQQAWDLDSSLPPQLRNQVIQLLTTAKASDIPTLNQFAVGITNPYPHTAFALRHQAWILGGKQGPQPLFAAPSGANPQLLPFDPAYDYATKPLGMGPGPNGLDSAIPKTNADEIRMLMSMTPAQFASTMPGQDMIGVLSSTADAADKGGWPVAAMTLRSKVDWLKKNAVATPTTTPPSAPPSAPPPGPGGAPAPQTHASSGTYRLDPELPPDIRRIVEHALDYNLNPDQLEGMAHMYANNAWTAYQLKHRAWEIRQNRRRW